MPPLHAALRAARRRELEGEDRTELGSTVAGYASIRRLTCAAENGSPVAVKCPRSASSADVASNVRPSPHSDFASATKA